MAGYEVGRWGTCAPDDAKRRASPGAERKRPRVRNEHGDGSHDFGAPVLLRTNGLHVLRAV